MIRIKKEEGPKALFHLLGSDVYFDVLRLALLREWNGNAKHSILHRGLDPSGHRVIRLAEQERQGTFSSQEDWHRDADHRVRVRYPDLCLAGYPQPETTWRHGCPGEFPCFSLLPDSHILYPDYR